MEFLKKSNKFKEGKTQISNIFKKQGKIIEDVRNIGINLYKNKNKLFMVHACIHF